MLVAFGVAIYKLEDANRFRQIDADLQVRVSALSRTIRQVYRKQPRPPIPPPWNNSAKFHEPPEPPPPPADRLSQDLSLPSETAALFGPQAGYYFLIWSRDAAVLRRSENAPIDIPPPSASDRDTLPHLRTRGTYRELVHCSGFGDCAMAGRSVAAELRSAGSLGWLLFATGVAVLLIGIGVGWRMIGHAIRPIEEIGTTAAEISNGRLASRVRVADRRTELGRLATVLNGTFARLEAAFARQRRFTSDAAHELRTPLAIMISEAQSTLARPRSANEYKETVEECLDIAQQMRKLTETLLDLARLDVDTGGTQRTRADLAEIALHCIQKLQPIAAEQEVSVNKDLLPARIHTTPGRIELVITNLLANAICYNHRGGRVFVTTRSDSGHATFRIADTGIGIGLADLPHIFERFYRADKARSRAQGHTGLGLAICKSILDAEGGTIQVDSQAGNGAVFTFTLPCGS